MIRYSTQPMGVASPAHSTWISLGCQLGPVDKAIHLNPRDARGSWGCVDMITCGVPERCYRHETNSVIR